MSSHTSLDETVSKMTMGSDLLALIIQLLHLLVLSLECKNSQNNTFKYVCFFFNCKQFQALHVPDCLMYLLQCSVVSVWHK